MSSLIARDRQPHTEEATRAGQGLRRDENLRHHTHSQCCTCTVSLGVYCSWLYSEPYIWKRDMNPSSTFGSIIGAIASPWLGAPPSSHDCTRSVTSSWYSIGGSTVSLPFSGCTTTAGPAGPASELECEALAALPRLARSRLLPCHRRLVPLRLEREGAYLRLAPYARVPHVEAHRCLRDAGLRRQFQLRQIEANQEGVTLVSARAPRCHGPRLRRIAPARRSRSARRLHSPAPGALGGAWAGVRQSAERLTWRPARRLASSLALRRYQSRPAGGLGGPKWVWQNARGSRLITAPKPPSTIATAARAATQRGLGRRGTFALSGRALSDCP